MANEKRYRYTGPLSGVTLRVKGEGGAAEERQVPLNPGAEVTLPADHPYTRKLLGKKLLTELGPASDPSDASEKSDKSDQTDKPRRPQSAPEKKEITENAG